MNNLLHFEPDLPEHQSLMFILNFEFNIYTCTCSK